MNIEKCLFSKFFETKKSVNTVAVKRSCRLNDSVQNFRGRHFLESCEQLVQPVLPELELRLSENVVELRHILLSCKYARQTVAIHQIVDERGIAVVGSLVEGSGVSQLDGLICKHILNRAVVRRDVGANFSVDFTRFFCVFKIGNFRVVVISLRGRSVFVKAGYSFSHPAITEVAEKAVYYCMVVLVVEDHQRG